MENLPATFRETIPDFAVDLLPAGWYGGAISLAAGSRRETPGQNEDGEGDSMDDTVTRQADAERMAGGPRDDSAIRVAGVVD